MAIVDQYGNPVNTAILKREIAAPTVTGVRSILSNHPAQGLTPGRLGALLREAETGDAIRYLELAEEMEEKNLHYLAVLGTRKRQVAQLDIKVIPAGDDDESKTDAELVQQWVDSQMLEDELVDVLDAIGKGFSVSEIMWEMSESQWWPMRIEHRDPRWFEFDDIDGRTLHMRGLENRLEPMAPFKFVQHRFKAKSGLPIRGGFARMVAWFYLFSNYAVRDWVEFISTYGQPFRIGKFPPGAGEQDKATLLRALTNLGTDAAAMIPESMMLEFAQVSGSGGGSSGSQATAHSSLLDYIDALISKAVLGQTLTTEAGDRGARSLGEVHDEVRHDIERSDALALTQTLTRDISEPLVKLNRGERSRGGEMGRLYPLIWVGREETLDIARVSDAYAKLSPLGLESKKSQWYKLLNLEEPEEGDDVIGGEAPPSPDPAGPPGNRGGNNEAAMARAFARVVARVAKLNVAGDADDEIDRAIEEALSDWEPLMENSVDPIRRAVREAGDLATLQARIEDGSLFAGMDSEEVARLLSNMASSADISGAG